MSLRQKESGVVASFEHLDSLLSALAAIQSKGCDDYEVFSPIPHHDIEKAVGGRKSKVRYFTFFGVVAGLFFGFGMAIGTSLLWDLITGGKPIVSMPPFLVIGFELAILFGGVFTLIAVLRLSRLPSRRSPGYHPSFSDDRFGLYVVLPPEQTDEVKALMEKHQAEKTWLTPVEDEP